MDTSSNYQEADHNPFGVEQKYRPKFSLAMVFTVLMVNTAVCSLLLLASRVPVIANVVADAMGQPRIEAGESDKTLHLTFLLACYTAPMVATAVISLLYYGVSKLNVLKARQEERDSEPESPFA